MPARRSMRRLPRLLYSLTEQGVEMSTRENIVRMPLPQGVVLSIVSIRPSEGISAQEIKDYVRLRRPQVDQALKALKRKNLIFSFKSGQ